MSRIRLNFDDRVFTYETLIRVWATDITVGAQASPEAMVTMLSEARARYLNAQGIMEVESDFDGILITDLATEFVSRALAHQELIFEVGLSGKNKYGGDIVIRVTRREDGSDVMRAKFGFVCYNFYTNQVIPVTEKINKLFHE